MTLLLERSRHVGWLESLFAIGFGCILIGLISLSYLTLGAHWPSDVIAGLCIGNLWLTTSIVVLERATVTSQKNTENFG